MTYNIYTKTSVFQYCKSKLLALEVMLTLSRFVTADVILDRLVPFMVGPLFNIDKF